MEAVAPDIPDSVGIAPDAIVTTIPPGGFPPPGAPPENIEIHAVIVSAAQSPWDAIKRAPGVGTITVVGGIVAMGKTPISRRNSGRRASAGLAQIDSGCPAFERLDDSASCTKHHGYSLAELSD